MIVVIGYKDGRECRHERCWDMLTADSVAEEMKQCTNLYDEVRIIEEDDNGKT
jgi:hypothetical protein